MPVASSQSQQDREATSRIAPDCGSRIVLHYKTLFPCRKRALFSFLGLFGRRASRSESHCALCHLSAGPAHRDKCHQLQLLHILQSALKSILFQVEVRFKSERSVCGLASIFDNDGAAFKSFLDSLSKCDRQELCRLLQVYAKTSRTFRSEAESWTTQHKTSLARSVLLDLQTFEFVAPLTKGAYGQLFLVRDRITGAVMAAKVFSISEAVQRDILHGYVEEREALLTCRSDYILPLYYSMRSEYFIFQMMEYVPGGDLSSHLGLTGRFSETQTRQIMMQMILALRELDRCGLVHGDIKPENILLATDGTIRLADFGLAFSTRRQDTRHKATLGTPEYMAPEQVTDHIKGPESDIWALGVCMYEFLTGLPPFYADTPDAILTAISAHEQIDWTAVSVPLSQAAKMLIDRMLDSSRVTRVTIKDISRLDFFAGCCWSQPPRIELPTMAERDIFAERNRRYGTSKFYGLAVLNSETVSYERPSELYTDHERIELSKLFPIKNLDRLQ